MDRAAVLAWIEQNADERVREGMARFGIPSDKAVGIPMGTMQKFAKSIGRDHALALALWETGNYEARTLAAYLGDPAQLTPAQMDRWCKDFDNWGICDTVCFVLFDKSPYAFAKIHKWARTRGEFTRRAAFALLASVALHDKQAPDEPFLAALPLIEAAALGDDRNFVKKGVLWALRGIARRNAKLKKASMDLAKRLAGAPQASARFVGKTALRS